jgi:RluA family pseudouridine synthase
MSKIKTFEYKIKPSENGLVLIDFLINKFTYLSLREWLIEIENKNLVVINKEINPSYKLCESDVLQFIRNSYSEPEVDKNFEIVYESENLLIINKPGNLPVHPAGRYKENTLLNLLTIEYKYENLFPAHRLDRETSGIQIFAKNKTTASVIQKQFENRSIYKEYIVYIHGIFPEMIHADGYLKRDEKSVIRKKKSFSSTFTENSTYCETLFKNIQEINSITKVLAIPKTGKNHQIRATLFSLGYPVYGDKIYGKDENCFLKFIQGEIDLEFKRQALHSHLIEIPESKLYPKIKIVVPEPLDLKEIFRQAEK